jgi:hypothetical protein
MIDCIRMFHRLREHCRQRPLDARLLDEVPAATVQVGGSSLSRCPAPNCDRRRPRRPVSCSSRGVPRCYPIELLDKSRELEP